MMLNEITQKAGRNKRPMRVGRGESSGKGKTCGRGNKGVQSRSGGGVHPLYEGGQMPIFRRLPKRGFSNVQFQTPFEVVNLGALHAHFDDGETVNLELLRKARLVQGRGPRVKVLAKGSLGKKLNVEAHAFSDKARQAIEGAGGSVSLIEVPSPQEAAKAKRNTAKNKKRSGQRATQDAAAEPKS